MKPSRNPVNRPRRYQVNENYVVRVTVEQPSSAEKFTANAQLLDLSPGGAKLSLNRPIRFEEALTIALHSEELELHLIVSARVCWTRQQGEGCWVLGCSFDPQLPREELEKLFAQGLLERRDNLRHSVRGQAVGRWEMHAEETPVGLLDLSNGGFSLLSPYAAQIGGNFHLSVDRESEAGPIEVLSTVQWQIQVDGGYIIGCAFADRRTFFTLRKRLCPDAETRSNRVARRALPLLSAAAVAALVYLCWQLF